MACIAVAERRTVRRFLAGRKIERRARRRCDGKHVFTGNYDVGNESHVSQLKRYVKVTHLLDLSKSFAPKPLQDY